MPNNFLGSFGELLAALPSQHDEPAFWLMLASSGLFLIASLMALFGEREQDDAQPESSVQPESSGDEDITLGSSSVDSGLSKTRSQLFVGLSRIFQGKSQIDQDALHSLEELLISSDLGVSTSEKLIQVVRDKSASDKSISGVRGLIDCLHDSVLEVLTDSEGIGGEIVVRGTDGPFVILVVGVNGVGKTTTIGKLAHHLKAQGHSVLLAAGDTFRAAAVEQLQAWAARVGVEIVSRAGENIKPSTVVYEAIEKAKSDSIDVLIVDTAGRLHTRINLMNELEKVHALLGRELPGAPHETLLVLDASTGQNALQQAREFHKRTALSGLIITKLDGTPKGGIVIPIKDELGIPIRYIGVGEGMNDLKPFDAQRFVDALLDSDQQEYQTEGRDSTERGESSERSEPTEVGEEGDVREAEVAEGAQAKRVAKRKRRHQ
jgi:fused signal recognition particle receptor